MVSWISKLHFLKRIFTVFFLRKVNSIFLREFSIAFSQNKYFNEILFVHFCQNIFWRPCGTKYFFDLFFSKNILFLGNKISKKYFVPHGRQNLFWQKWTINISWKYFLRENAILNSFRKILLTFLEKNTVKILLRKCSFENLLDLWYHKKKIPFVRKILTQR